MRKEKKYMLAATLTVIGLTTSCKQEKETYTEQIPERPMTNITIMGNETTWNAGTISNAPKQICAKEWLVQNTGGDTLFVDSVTTSCECAEVVCEQSMKAGPLEYFPVRVLLHSEGEIGPFFREINVYGNFENSPLTLTIEGEYKKTEDVK